MRNFGRVERVLRVNPIFEKKKGYGEIYARYVKGKRSEWMLPDLKKNLRS